jgi:putative addiction module killer protein
MIEVVQSEEFIDWLDGLRDRRAQEKISQRLSKVQNGYMGDTKPVGDGVHELRVDYGAGYRLYYIWIENTMIVLLVGGDKSSQKRDINKAKKLANVIRKLH